jgi:hypothetical protein
MVVAPAGSPPWRHRLAVIGLDAALHQVPAPSIYRGAKTGELTPDAIDAFTTIAGGAGRLAGPRGGAETLAAGGKRSRPPSRALEDITGFPFQYGTRRISPQKRARYLTGPFPVRMANPITLMGHTENTTAPSKSFGTRRTTIVRR